MSHNGHNIKAKDILKATGAKDWKEAIVKLGYGERFGLGLEDRILDFSVKLGTPEEVLRIMSQIDAYNNFRGEELAEVIATLMHQGTIMYVEFGRRGSPELHVFMRNPEDDRQKMMDLLTKFSPDELDEAGPYGIRAWWD